MCRSHRSMKDFVSREFSREPDGTNVFSRFQWNAATQRYDRFQTRFTPALNTATSS